MLITNLYAVELSIIPLKKPILNKIEEQQNVTQGIIKPKAKPIKNLENLKLSKENTKTEQKTIVKKSNKIVIDKNSKIDFLIPKKKTTCSKKRN